MPGSVEEGCSLLAEWLEGGKMGEAGKRVVIVGAGETAAELGPTLIELGAPVIPGSEGVVGSAEKAVAVAKQNAARLGMSGIQFFVGDWTAPLSLEKSAFDMIISNPPWEDGTVTDPADHVVVLAELQADGKTSLVTRRRLAEKGFTHTAEYDAAIRDYLTK